MDPRHLEYFVGVAEHGSVSAAALALGVSQSAVSQGLHALEHELSSNLFNRTATGMVPTPAARAMIGPARRLRRRMAQIPSAVSGSSRSQGLVEFSVTPSMAFGSLARAVARFKRLNPDVTFSIAEVPTEADGVGHVANGSYEIFFAHLAGDVVAQIDRISDLETVHLGWHETWVAYPPQTRLNRDSEAMRWEDLPDLPMIVVQRGGVRVQVIEDMVRNIGRPTMPSLVLEHREARLAYVMRGIGGCFIEGTLIEEARRRGAVVARLEPPLKTPLGLVYSKSTASAVAQEFIATCVSVFEESDEESGRGADRPSADDEMFAERQFRLESPVGDADQFRRDQ